MDPEAMAVDQALGGSEPAEPPEGSDPVMKIVQILQQAGLDEQTIMAILSQIQGGDGATPGGMPAMIGSME